MKHRDTCVQGTSSRREFIKHSALIAGAGVWIAASSPTRALQEQPPSERLNVACIGIGGKGNSDSEQVARHANIVAVCDVDDKRLDTKMAQEVKGFGRPFEKAGRYNDFRKMFDQLGKSIDAVTISTPDHMHAAATMMAIRLGKHVYTQKPMAHDVWEARQLRLAAIEYKTVSQMGNQGTANSKFREGVEVIRAGLLGAVTEVHVWTNRPIWPQAPQIMTRPPAQPVPPYLHWDEWLGTAPERPYNAAYHPFKWRGFWDFGCGALGDMGCHTANLPFMALNLAYPTSIQAEAGDVNPETYPSWARVTYEFPRRGELPPVKLIWYEGKKDGTLVHPPAELVAKVLAEAAKAPLQEEKGKKKGGTTGPAVPKTLKLSSSGSIIVGERGIVYSPDSYGSTWYLLPPEDFRDYKAPPQTLPRNPMGDDEGQKVEWIAAIKGGPPALSNFNYASMLTESILLGNVAIRSPGVQLQWDGPNMKFPNAPESEKLLRRDYRSPWSLS